jgi:hypothetical protein
VVADVDGVEARPLGLARLLDEIVGGNCSVASWSQ